MRLSTDGATWSTIKTIDNSQGGVEDWTNLNGQGRYLRMQGIKRSSGYGYGYSLLEAQFKTPGSDNSMATLATSALKFPTSGSGFVPLWVCRARALTNRRALAATLATGAVRHRRR